ncbi:MAG: UDP-glucose 4-epimerase GalE [Imperialibacter sp.]|uniref:UDP-glucose 4-epimerase GalE n=1 Tax=Imperialibacter sp. TaxID=2038411 RepID=UPI0032EE8379
MRVLVTGSTGYIGSHTLLDLMESSFPVVSLDDFSRSSSSVLDILEKSTGKKIHHHKVDLTVLHQVRGVFEKHPDIDSIIHFAAFKSVSESVENALLYYNNNILSLTNTLQCASEFGVKKIVFSSSCTVYGTPTEIPVKETTPLGKTESPYGATKQMGEQIIRDFVVSNPGFKAVLLRYFNPAGAHPSGLIGEQPIGRPQNLVPAITQSAIGKLQGMQVYGSDYPTRDGSCIRDFIHVCDLAQAHRLALEFMMEGRNSVPVETFNLGTGTGVTVLEAIHAFERASGKKLEYKIVARRPGDIVAIYANNDKAADLLGWRPKYSLDEIMRTAWAWEQNLSEK